MFYDFSRAYREFAQKPMITAGDSSDAAMNEDEERKIERNQRMAASGEEGKTADGDESDDWEDIDCDDGDMEEVEEVDSEEEEGSSEPSSS